MSKGNNGIWYIFLPKFCSMRFILKHTKVWSQTFGKNICCRLQVESSLAVCKYSCCVELDETISKSCAQEILEIYAWALAVCLSRHSRLYLLITDSDVSCRTCSRKCLMNWIRMKIHLRSRHSQPYMLNIPFANDVLRLIVYWIKLRILYLWWHTCVEPRIGEVLCVFWCVWFSERVCMCLCFRVRVWMWNVMCMNVWAWFCSYGFVQ